MRLANLTQAVALFPLLVACSNSVSQGTCARTQAIVGGTGSGTAATSLENDAMILTKAGLPRNTPGGYIDLDSYVDKETGRVLINYESAVAEGRAVKKTRRCTALVSFETGDSQDTVRVWTADHCVQPASDVAMRLQLYGNGGYTAFDVRSAVFELVQKARADSKSLRPVSRALFLSAFNTHETNASKSGARACKELKASYAPGGDLFASKLAQSESTKADNPADYSHACFSMADLSTLRLKLLDPVASFDAEKRVVWEESRSQYAKLRQFYAGVQSDTATLQDFTVRVGQEMFYRTFNELMNVRRQESFLGFNEAVFAGRCTVDGSPCQDGEGEKLKALANRYFDKRNFYENDVAEKVAQLVTANFDLGKAITGVGQSLLADVGLGILTGKAEGREKFRAASDVIWKAIDAGASATSGAEQVLASASTQGIQPAPAQSAQSEASRLHDRFQYTFQANVHPQGKPSQVRWRWLSTQRSRADDNRKQDDGHKIILGLHDSSDPFARVMILSSHRKQSPYLFEKGDSGTATSVFVFPFGVLSTVDWEETEGIPVTTLPRAGTYDDGPVMVAGRDGAPGKRGTGAENGAENEAEGQNGYKAGRKSEVASGAQSQGRGNRADCL